MIFNVCFASKRIFYSFSVLTVLVVYSFFTEIILNTPVWGMDNCIEQDKTSQIWTSRKPEEVIPIVQEALKSQVLQKGIFFSVSNPDTKLSYCSKMTIALNINLNNEKIGYIKFIPEQQKDTTLKKGHTTSNRIIYLMKIDIDDQWQGQGYGSSSMRLFNAFVDDLNADCTHFVIDSDKPYAGKMYANAGYVFTNETNKDVEGLAKANKISFSEAKEQFLNDTTKFRVKMLRYKNSTQ